MKQRKFKRETAHLASMSLPALMKQAKRNKRLKRNALAGRFRTAYAQRKMLAQAYGREIARRLAK